MGQDSVFVEVTAPSRLHFGLMCNGVMSDMDEANRGQRVFGGIGVMLEGPNTRVRVGWDLDESGTRHRRAAGFLEQFNESANRSALKGAPPLEVSVHSVPPEHVGLGSGTQLALSIARAGSIWTRQSDLTGADLAAMMGRGSRSGIGVNGFDRGGFLVDAGKPTRSAEIPAVGSVSEKTVATTLAPWVARVDFPESWPIILAIPRDSHGLSGSDELQAFDELPAISQSTTDRLCRLVLLGILPSLIERDLKNASDSLYDYGRLAGECFAGIQGGTYQAGMATDLVAHLRSIGVAGVTQSSWGPTIAAVIESTVHAEWVRSSIIEKFGDHSVQVIITRADNRGARTKLYDSKPPAN